MILTTSLLKTPPYLSQSSIETTLADRHPSRLKMTIQDYLLEVWHKMKDTEGSLSLILIKIDGNCLQKRVKLDQLTKVMRSLAQGVDDFVGFGEQDQVIVILPQTDLGEAVQILDQIYDYYSDKVEHLEIISTIPNENSTIQPLLSKICGNLHQFN